MAGVRRQATFPELKSEDAIVLQVADRVFVLRHAQIRNRTGAQIEQTIRVAARQAGVTLPTITVHVNRDGSYALACGEPPAIWPEDYPFHDGSAAKL